MLVVVVHEHCEHVHGDRDSCLISILIPTTVLHTVVGIGSMRGPSRVILSMIIGLPQLEARLHAMIVAA